MQFSLQVDMIGKFRLQEIKKNDGLSCMTRNESYTFNVSYIELVQQVEFDTIIFQGANEEVKIEVPSSLFANNSSIPTSLFANNSSIRDCIGWVGANFQPNLFSTRMLPNYPENAVSVNVSNNCKNKMESPYNGPPATKVKSKMEVAL